MNQDFLREWLIPRKVQVEDEPEYLAVPESKQMPRLENNSNVIRTQEPTLRLSLE